MLNLLVVLFVIYQNIILKIKIEETLLEGIEDSDFSCLLLLNIKFVLSKRNRKQKTDSQMLER